MTESFGGMRRTHSCGALRAGDAGRTVTLMGWASRRRDHGGLIFVDLRDRDGVTQLVFNPAVDPAAHEIAGRIRVEFVLGVEGTVERRPPGTVNTHLATGEIEVSARRLRILNESKPLPFPLDESQETAESLRLKYRYLDLRRPAMLGHLLLRDQVCRATRDYLHGESFVEVETPMLTRSTPEGARDFLVPSRLTPGTFYALPQSPQLFKQILMVGGLERYFQIVRCFRDEDLRADRQPEFTQIDIETAFLDRDDFLPLMEGLVARDLPPHQGPRADPAVPPADLGRGDPALRLGQARPALRARAQRLLRPVPGRRVPGLRPGRRPGRRGAGPDGAGDRLLAQGPGRPGRSAPRAPARRGWSGSAWARARFRARRPATWSRSGMPLLARTGAKAGDLVLLVADRMPLAATVLGRLRVELAHRLGLIPAGAYDLLWVVDFPAGRVERGRAAVGRDAPSLHGAAGRGRRSRPGRPGAARAPRPTISS